MSRAKHWCWTLNNYTTADTERLTALGTELPTPIIYLVWGHEKGEQETPHLQGFVSLEKKCSLRYIRDLISDKAHYETARGKPHQAATYCKKDGDFKEFGNCPNGQGNRSDLDQIAEKCRTSVAITKIAEEHPASFLRYAGNIVKLKHLYRPQRSGQPIIHVFWGRTGTGKTRRVWQFADEQQIWISSGTRWFDGYDGQPGALFDDFSGGWFEITYILKLLDRYPFPVPVKGGFVWWCPKTVFITSNIKPDEWYPNAAPHHREALKRRLREFGSVTECTTDNYPW